MKATLSALHVFTLLSFALEHFWINNNVSMVESFQPIPIMIKKRNHALVNTGNIYSHAKIVHNNYGSNEMQISIPISSSSASNMSRRRTFKEVETLFKASSVAILKPFQAQAAEEKPTSKKIMVQGIVTVQPGTEIETSESSTNPTLIPALYLTARPNKVDNVPKAILDGSRGKPPPVLIARYPLSPNETRSQFPFEFVLTEDDLTIEGQSQWFVNSKEDLIISARLDLDGIAATRDPGDLVGRGIYFGKPMSNSDSEGIVKVQLQGRGIGGKFVTKKSK